MPLANDNIKVADLATISDGNTETGRDASLANIEPHKWIAGQSGNPTGRPKIPDVIKDKLKNASPEAVDTLISIMHNPKSRASDRIKCAEIIMDRAYGKPVQQIDGIDNNIMVVLSPELQGLAE